MAPTEGTEQPARTSRRLLDHAVSALWLLAAILVGWLIWPSSLGGCTTLTIVSGHSMEPTYYTGDLVVSRCGPVQVDDVIVYHPPDIPGARVIHRIVDGNSSDGWIVQGDNNDFLDPWMPTEEHILGSAVLHLPHVGKFASVLLSPLTWMSIIVVALAVVIWPNKDEPAPDDGPPDADRLPPPGSDGGHGPVPDEPDPGREGEDPLAVLAGVGTTSDVRERAPP